MFSKTGSARIQVKELSRVTRKNHVEAEFDAGDPFEGIREHHVLGSACDGPIVFRMRYYSQSGQSSKWQNVLNGVISSLGEMR